MSTQFRSRIKTVVDYSASASAAGGCCLPDGTKLAGNVTINECNQQRGFFRAGDPTTLQCPDRGLTGCCCSCSYIREQEGNFDTFLGTVLSPNADDSTVYHAQPVGDNLDEYVDTKTMLLNANASIVKVIGFMVNAMKYKT
jgi:hypothetical protein